LITKDGYEKAMDQWNKPGGCKEHLIKCQKQAREDDPDWQGNVPPVVKCFKDMKGICPTLAELSTGNSVRQIGIRCTSQVINGCSSAGLTSPIPQQTRHQNHVRLIPTIFHDDPTDTKPDMHGFLNQAWVLEALGVPVNFSHSSSAVATAFDGTADLERAGSSEAVSYLLDSGVKVHMMYGDRDYACNWLGGEAASLGIDYSGGENFRQAGYAPILSSNGTTGGFVRQYGNFSFSRVFQAGHEGE
jgi:carboxypeptidase C (cathepsin A)